MGRAKTCDDLCGKQSHTFLISIRCFSPRDGFSFVCLLFGIQSAGKRHADGRIIAPVLGGYMTTMIKRCEFIQIDVMCDGGVAHDSGMFITSKQHDRCVYPVYVMALSGRTVFCFVCVVG